MAFRKIMVWDVPRKIYEDMKKHYGFIKEEDFLPFPDELRIFCELDPKKVLFRNLMCLQIFPKTEEREMRTILNFWVEKNIKGYKDSKVDFASFSREALIRINGGRFIAGSKVEDVIALKFPKTYINVEPAVVWLAARTMMVASNLVSDPMFLKKKYTIVGSAGKTLEGEK